MTDSSLLIRLYPASTTDEQMERYDAESTGLASLTSPPGGSYTVRDWANSHGLPVHYVDNCWVRVPVSPADLDRFAAEVLKKPPLAIEYAPDDGLCVIEAEDF